MSNLKQAVHALSGIQPKKGQLAAAMQAIAEQTQQASQKAIRNQIAVNKQKLLAMIKSERISQNLTQKQLADKCDLSQSTISKSEKSGWISFSCLLKIATGLGREIIIN